jgi:hypothetical protein
LLIFIHGYKFKFPLLGHKVVVVVAYRGWGWGGRNHKAPRGIENVSDGGIPGSPMGDWKDPTHRLFEIHLAPGGLGLILAFLGEIDYSDASGFLLLLVTRSTTHYGAHPCAYNEYKATYQYQLHDYSFFLVL